MTFTQQWKTGVNASDAPTTNFSECRPEICRVGNRWRAPEDVKEQPIRTGDDGSLFKIRESRSDV